MASRTHFAIPVILAATLAAPVSLAASADHEAVDTLIAKVQACSRTKDIPCLQKHVDDPETFYGITQDGKRELLSGFMETAFNSRSASLNTVSVGDTYRYKIISANSQAVNIVFYNRYKSKASDTFEQIASTEDFVPCLLVRKHKTWKVSNSVCHFIYAGEFE